MNGGLILKVIYHPRIIIVQYYKNIRRLELS